MFLADEAPPFAWSVLCVLRKLTQACHWQNYLTHSLLHDEGCHIVSKLLKSYL